jgi:tetratricopeptide (TPR) repeat protein
MTGDLLGTLRYVSPEQADGKKLLDHRTDIYSLGTTLYELLTLRPALDGNDRATLLRQLEGPRPCAPRSIDAKIPKDFETILLKAMARCPEDRYNTAAQLADDLRRFLEHKPIKARRASNLNRAKHWIRRNRQIAILTVSLILTLLAMAVGGPIVAVRYARLAVAEAKSRRMAEVNQQDLQRILSDTMARMAESLEDAPGMTGFQRKLIDDVEAYYDRLLERNGQDLKVRFDAASAFRRIATTEELAASFERSVSLRKKAIRILNGLLAETPSNADYLRMLAIVYRALGTQYYYANNVDPDEAVRYCRQSLEAIQRAKPPNKDDLSFQLDLAYVHYFLAGALRIQGALEDCKQQLRSAEAITRDLIQQFPTNDYVSGCAAYVIAGLGSVETETGHFNSGETRLCEALQLYERSSPPTLKTRLSIPKAQDRGYLGVLLHCQRRPIEAVQNLSTSVEQLKTILAKFGNIEWAHEALEFQVVSCRWPLPTSD